MSKIVSIFTLIVWVLFKCVSTAVISEKSPCLCLKKVVEGLYNPVEYVTIRRRNSLLALVVEQRGIVRAFSQEHQERKAVFMNITDRVTTSDSPGEERGLLSLALHPSYNRTRRGRVFVYYVTTVTDRDRVVVSEFQAADDIVDVTSERQLLHVDQPSVKANGGQLLFGDDGYLYIFTGDGAGHNESVEHAQDLGSYLGKALRVDVDRQGYEGGQSARAFMYDIPASNPYFLSRHPPARPEIFAVGFFNPWRCSQDSVNRGGTGAIYCGDTGSDLFEEINVIAKGRNYGWNLKEGNHCFSSPSCSQIENEGVPIHVYPYSRDWGSAVVGGFVYRGKTFSSLVGNYIYGDAVTGEVNLLHQDQEAGSGQWNSRPWPVCPQAWCPCHARASKQPFLLAFGLDPRGEVMLMMSSEFSVLRPKGVLYHALPPTGNDKKAVTCGGTGLSPRHLLLLLFLALVIHPGLI